MAEDLYSTEATSSRGSVRVGGRGDLAYAIGEPGDGTADPLNPERLYAAALATCVHQSLVIAATSLDVEPGESVVTAKVTLAARGDGGYELRATVEVYLPGATTDSLYDAVTREALRMCPLVGTRITTDPHRQLPTGTEPTTDTEFDFSTPRKLGPTSIDYAFTELRRDADRLAWVRSRGPDGATAELWADDSIPYLELFTGDTLPPDRRRRGMGVEPMTCPPNAFHTQTDVLRLEPGTPKTTRWGVRLRH